MRREKILIVEHNPTVARAIERAGMQLELESDRASDGWEAIELLETEDYAAIVIDTDMPRHSGFGVLTYLREENGDALGHVILMATDSDQVRTRVADMRLQVIRTTDEIDVLARCVDSARASN